MMKALRSASMKATILPSASTSSKLTRYFPDAATSLDRKSKDVACWEQWGAPRDSLRNHPTLAKDSPSFHAMYDTPHEAHQLARREIFAEDIPELYVDGSLVSQINGEQIVDELQWS